MASALRSLRVGFVSPGWPPAAIPNGIVTSVASLKLGLESAGHTAHVFSLTNPTSSGGNIHFIHPRHRRIANAINRLSRRIGGTGRVVCDKMAGLRQLVKALHERGEIDILEIEETWGQARHLAGRLPLPVVVRLHGPWFLNGSANGADRNDPSYIHRVSEEGRGIAAADAVSAPSSCVLESVRSFYGMSLPHAVTLPYAVKSAEARDAWSIDRCNAETILFIGRFDRHKGGDTVIRAFERIAKVRPSAKLLFCGPDRGFVDEAGDKWSFYHFCKKVQISSDAMQRVEFLGYQSPEAVAELRRRASVTVMASRWENFANTILEALAVGSPLVATSSGGTPEMVRDGETGLLVPPDNPSAMADAVIRILVDNHLAMRLGRNAWEDARQRFAPEHVTCRTVAFYRQVLACWPNRYEVA